MKSRGRNRAFWLALAVEIEKGAKLDEVARRHQVTKKTLSWWCWRFRFDGEMSKTKSRTRTRLLPVVAPAVPVTSSTAQVEVTVLGAHFRFSVGTDVEYVTALVRALRGRC